MSELELHTSSARTPVLLAAFGEWVTGLPLYGSIAATIWIPYQVLQVLLALVLGVPAAADAVQAAGKAAAADQPFDESGAVAAAGRLLLFGLVTLALALVAAALSQAAPALSVARRLRGGAAGGRDRRRRPAGQPAPGPQPDRPPLAGRPPGAGRPGHRGLAGFGPAHRGFRSRGRGPAGRGVAAGGRGRGGPLGGGLRGPAPPRVDASFLQGPHPRVRLHRAS